MPRDIPVGNGTLLITFDQDYCLRDIYYPFVGKENHTEGHKFRMGIWVDGKFDWVTRDWGLRLDYAYEMLMTQVTALNSVEGARLIPVLKERYYSARGAKAIPRNRNRAVIVVRAISGTNTI